MKCKIIIALAVLLTGSISASPNKCGKGLRCAGNGDKQSTTTPLRAAALMIDDAELLPMHHYLHKF
jgi:hypothetical protein